MKSIDNQTTPQIYYRPLRKWIEVTPEEKQNWERFIGTTRKAKQRASICCIPYIVSQSFQSIRFLRPFADDLDQPFLAHLAGQQVGSGFFDMQQLLQFLVAHFAVFFEIVQNDFHLRRNDRRGGL